MDKHKILVVDDDKNICEILNLYLAANGYELYFANNGTEAINLFREIEPVLVILDIMLPVINGWEVCKLIRRESQVPIIMLSAKETTEDKVAGLEIGADDYIVKPFDPKEVVARVKANLRRPKLTNYGSEDIIQIGNLEVSLNTYEVRVNNRLLELKPKEIQLLFFLLKSPNQVFDRGQLLENVWGYDYSGETRTVDVHIKRLREKLKGSNSSCRIKTIWGIGYKLEVK